MKLTHIGISQFRSIGTEPVMIDLTKRITVLVGQNDCGKSNVLRGIEHVCELRPIGKPRTLTDIDNHQRNPACPPTVSLRCVPDEKDSHQVRENPAFTFRSIVRARLDSDLSSPEIDSLGERDFRRLLAGTAASSGGGHLSNQQLSHKRNEVAKLFVNELRNAIPAPRMVPQYRRIDKGDQYSIDGKGIIKLLAKWHPPAIGEEHLKTKFDRVVKLLRELLNRPQATLEVPAAQSEIVVADGTMRLPLESHGTGVHQLIILAIAVLSEDDVLFGIEEPEIHLHPVLQRRFLQFLLRETTNRYLITTHSSALIAPSDEVDVIHLKMVGGVTIPTRVDTDANALAVLNDLGVRASDLLQANSVVWVEGPSDRIYLNRWLELMEPNLREGVDYSIMFYGGRLLSHLSLERDEREESGFIKLLRINQRSAILIDSDRHEASDSVNETKGRIQSECVSNHLHAWLTDGREIENYLAEGCVNAALIEHGANEASISIERFEKFESSMQKASGKSFKPSWAYDKHKPAWAHRFVKHMTRDQIKGDLQTRLTELIAFIKPR